MARPVMRDPTGRWSLAQIATAAGITYRTARTLVASNYLEPDHLGSRDIAYARVAAALLEAPRPSGRNRVEVADEVTDRNRAALALARQVTNDPRPNEEATLVILPTEAHLATKSLTLVTLFAEFQGQPMLLLPVGAWAREAAEAVLDGVAS